MDASQSAFFAYKNAPKRFAEEKKSPKKQKSKVNRHDRSFARAESLNNNRTASKKQKKNESIKVSSSQDSHNGSVAKVSK